MRIGSALPHVGPVAGQETIHTVATEAERLGYDSLWTLERVRLGVSVVNLPYHHPGAVSEADRDPRSPLWWANRSRRWAWLVRGRGRCHEHTVPGESEDRRGGDRLLRCLVNLTDACRSCRATRAGRRFLATSRSSAASSRNRYGSDQSWQSIP